MKNPHFIYLVICGRRSTILRYMCGVVYFRLHLLVLIFSLFFIFSLFKIRFVFHRFSRASPRKSPSVLGVQCFLVICANYTHAYGANGVGYSLCLVPSLLNSHPIVLCHSRMSIHHHPPIYIIHAMPF